jgi:hypothetical protein
MCERLAHQAEILTQRIALDELLAIPLRAFLARENAENAVVRPTVGGKPDLLHRITRINPEDTITKTDRGAEGPAADCPGIPNEKSAAKCAGALRAVGGF